MRLGYAIFHTTLKAIVFIGIPIGLIYVLNANYPGLLSERYLRTLTIAMYLGIPIVLLYFFTDITEGIKSMVAELIALVLIVIYTLLILGYGRATLFYDEVNISLYYPYLLYLLILGVLIRFPAPVLRYLTWRESNEEDYYEEYEY